MRLMLLLFLLLVIAGANLRSQGANLPASLGEFHSYGDNYFIEMLSLPSSVAGRSRSLVLLRLTYDLLTFQRGGGTGHTGSAYIATPSIFVEALSAEGVIADRGIWRDTVRVDSFSITNAKDRLVAGTIKLSLRPGRYTLKYYYENGVPGNGFSRTTDTIIVRDFERPSVVAGEPLLLRDVLQDTLVAAAIDASAPYGRPLRAFIPFGGATAPLSVHYELLRSIPGEERIKRVEVRSGTAKLLGRVSLSQGFATDGNLMFLLSRDENPDSARLRGALIETRIDDLPTGDYELVVRTDGAAGATIDTFRFPIRWVDIPFSLARTDYALKALYAIATDDKIETMSRGDQAAQRDALNRFWAERDPTPGTIFNEAMTEYYRRVDYSFFNFRSLGRTDGVFSDRGKIYILNGRPTEVAREMSPNTPPCEVWTYRNRVGYIFTFADESRTGDYRLVSYVAPGAKQGAGATER